MIAREVNFDGLVGPTHNYGGLSVGNIASMKNEESASNPREAALQGLEKMRALMARGLVQGFLPPHERPHIPTLRKLGFSGSDAEIVTRVAREAPLLLRNTASASSMWTANAATVSPSVDSNDDKLHLTPANLQAMFHRAIEHPQTEHILRAAFPGERFSVHGAVTSGGALGDEGAANHGRLCAEHGAPGLQLFVYGRSAFDRSGPTQFPARQAKEASLAIARQHQLDDAQIVMIQQNPAAIDAGAFHNDVVSVANGPALLYHEHAFAEAQAAREEIQRKAEILGFEPIFIEVAQADVPLDDAITSYLFNSQLITQPDGGMLLLLPIEAEENPRTRAWCAEAVAGNGPITETLFLDLRQSMRNGGGPACLRLRVVMTDDELKTMHQGFLLTEERITWLEAWVRSHYRDRLTAGDLADPALLDESRRALDELNQFLDVPALYPFQGETPHQLRG
ncbi:MAG: N-succinylarginine dihydrolase [Pseudomonadota bacterium]